MREVNVQDILKSQYSINNGKVTEDKNGEIFSKQIAEQILVYQGDKNYDGIQKLKNLDLNQQRSKAYKLCLERYLEMKISDSQFDFYNFPRKKYEIYKLALEKEKLMMCDTKYFVNADEKEVYYDKKIAIEIYDLKVELEENVINSFPEIMEMYQQEIYEKQVRIERLEKSDEEKFQEAVKIYELVNKSDIFQELKNKYELSENENAQLKNRLDKANTVITDLSKKLEITLNKYQELKSAKLTFWERVIGFFNKQKRLTNGKK